MTLRIITDSTCDLPESIVAELGITVVPLVISTGHESFLDGVEMSRAEFYRRLPEFPVFPKTSTPSPGTFVRSYEALAATGATEILSIHIAASLSAVTTSARLAAEETNSARVTVIDSGQLSLGVGFMVLEAARLAAEGASAAEVEAAIQRFGQRVHVFALLDTVEYLRRSGRINGMQFGVASLLRIKPILTMHDGIAGSERVRTWKSGVERLATLVRGLGPLERLAMIHTHAAQRADEFRHELEQTVTTDSRHSIDMSAEVTPVIGAHVGPGAVGVACVTAQR